MNEQKEIPIIVAIEKAKEDMYQQVNRILQEYHLPCYLMDMILSDIVHQLKNSAKNELAQAMAQIGAVDTAPKV